MTQVNSYCFCYVFLSVSRVRSASCQDLVYEYSSSGESGTSETCRRRQLGGARSDAALHPARRSVSPAPPPAAAATRAPRRYRQRAVWTAPCLARRSRASVPSPAAPLHQLERQFTPATGAGTNAVSSGHIASAPTEDGGTTDAYLSCTFYCVVLANQPLARK